MIFLAMLFACDDTRFPVPEKEGETEEGFCAVTNLFSNDCLACHSSAARLGDLDLETDPAAVVGWTSSLTGLPLVVPGEPENSFLYRKLAGELEPGEGGVMPPTGSPGPAVLGAIHDWIAEGASTACEDDGGGGGGETRTHPIGYADPDVHGYEAKLQVQDCRSCHGDDLTGLVGPSCDTCHGSPSGDAWRTDCKFCHGEPGVTSAPPRQIDGSWDPSTAAFPDHRAHTDGTTITGPLLCTACHVEPTGPLSVGHLFVGDVTPGVAEVDFSGGIAAGGTWDGASCTVSCHGDDPISAGSTMSGDCEACHDGPGTAPDDMSGEHEEHLDEDVGCEECHSTVDGGGAIATPSQHLNGVLDVTLPDGITRDANGRCTGSCHGESHSNRSW